MEVGSDGGSDDFGWSFCHTGGPQNIIEWTALFSMVARSERLALLDESGHIGIQKLGEVNLPVAASSIFG
jgi:hypothetical protein